MNPPLEDIANLGSLRETMDAQAAITDAIWSRAQDRQYSETDWETFRDVGVRIQATAARSRAWSRGDLFDSYAIELGKTGAALVTAVEKRDNDLAAQALLDMHDTCKSCHDHVKPR